MTSRHRAAPLPPRTWTTEELDEQRRVAIANFREDRMKEPLAAYLAVFGDFQAALTRLLDQTDDLTQLEARALSVLQEPELLEVVRYLAAPPISMDDLRILVGGQALSRTALAQNRQLVADIVATVMTGLDRQRFPWIPGGRAPSPVEREAAILATTALIASRRVETLRRTEGKTGQEARVQQTLAAAGLQEVPVPKGGIPTEAHAPSPGTFCREVLLGKRKADLVVRLWDTRMMPIECKVSNSALNSIKRLNNDAAVKAGEWRTDLGVPRVVPVAVLSGVFNLHSLEDAQNRGLTLYWAHRLGDLVDWIEQTRLVG